MVQGYYSLDEAAKVLGMPVDTLSQMARKREIRAFSDAGSWKFRAQDIDEMARSRSFGSDPEIRLPDIDAEPGDSIMDDDEVLLDESALSGLKLDGSDSEATVIGMRGPDDSESDVRLVLSGQDEGSDSGVKLVPDLGGTPSKPTNDLGTGMGAGAGAKLSDSDRGRGATEDDIGLGDSNIGGPTDSDIRLTFDDSGLTPGSSRSNRKKEGSSKTRRAEAARDAANRERLDQTDVMDVANSGLLKSHTPPKNNPAVPTTTSSDSDLDFNFDDDDVNFSIEGLAPPAAGGSSRKATKPPEDHDDLDRTVAMNTVDFSDDDIDLSLDSGDSDLTKGGPSSGINLAKPDDSGISLEDPSSVDETNSEFELSLDSDADELFDSADIDFKDDEDAPKPSPAKGKPAAAPSAGSAASTQPSKIISGSENASDSDFELALGDDDFEAEQESGSEVIAIDEDDDDDGIEAVEEEAEEIEASVAEDEDEEDSLPATGGAAAAVLPRQRVVAATEVEWGAGWLVPLSLTTIMLVLTGMMMYEVMRSAWSYNTPYTMSATLIDQVYQLAKSIGIVS